MPRTADKVDALIREDAEMEGALSTVREQADANGGEVEWSDVRDDLTSGQWGRMIEQGILVDGDDGFEIADREAFDEALDGDGEDRFELDIDPEESKWTRWDKLAGVTALLFMVGYWWNPARDALGGTMDLVLGPLDAALPFFAVVLAVSMITGLYSSILQSNLMNMERMSQYQERMKDIQRRRKEAKDRGDEAELERIQEEQIEAMGDQLGMFKEQFRPMVWIMLLTIPLFLWMYWRVYAVGVQPETMVLPMMGEVEWTRRVRGIMPVWIVWYFLCSMGFTQLLRKALNIDMTPSTS